jgi:putative addiction module antidote
MYTVKVRRIGNSAGVTLPKEVLARLRVAEGDVLLFTEAPDGFGITAYDPTFADAMEAYARTRKRYANALRRLAQ